MNHRLREYVQDRLADAARRASTATRVRSSRRRRAPLPAITSTLHPTATPACRDTGLPRLPLTVAAKSADRWCVRGKPRSGRWAAGGLNPEPADCEMLVQRFAVVRVLLFLQVSACSAVRPSPRDAAAVHSVGCQPGCQYRHKHSGRATAVCPTEMMSIADSYGVGNDDLRDHPRSATRRRRYRALLNEAW